MMKNRRRDYNKNNEHFQTRKFDMWNENKLFLYLQKPIVKEYLWKGGHKVVELTNMCWKMVSTHGVHTMVVYPDQYIPSHVPAYKCNCTELLEKFNHPDNLWEAFDTEELCMKLAPWNLQEATYDKAMWILGSTPDLNLEELSIALNQDKFLKGILPVEVVWDKIESEYLEVYEEGQRPVYAAHICCPKDTALQCVAQIILMFADTRKTGYPLDTIFQCIVNTGSQFCTAQTAKDRRKTVTFWELHQIWVQDSMASAALLGKQSANLWPIDSQ